MNYDLLKKMAKERGFSMVDISLLIDMPKRTFQWQIKNERLSVSKFLEIVDLLGLTNDEVLEILNLK